MANVLLTERCVRSCPYCFAKKHMADKLEDDILSWQNLIYIADLVQASNENHISLLGGEPTLHPNFVEYVIYLIERGFHVNVFTSGIMAENKLSDATRMLSEIPIERLSFVCNLNDPEKSNFSEVESVKRFLKIFGHITTPGFNIYHPDFSLDFIFDYVNRFGLIKHLRLGLAHPIPGKKNKFVGLPDMKAMANRLMSYQEHFERFRVKPGLDCGFPLCTFEDEEIGKLFKLAQGRLTFGCGPAIDIGTDMNVWACFPLSNFHKKSLFEFDSMREVIDYYQEIHRKVRIEVGGIYEKCDDCLYREDNLCSGGCIAHVLSNFQNEANIRMEEMYK